MLPINYTYQLLVFRNQVAPLEVKATCAEEACQLVKRSFTGRDFGMVEFDSFREMRDHWLVMRTTAFEYCRHLHIESWDGQRFRSFGKGEPGDDIITAVRTCSPEYFTPAAATAELVYAAA
jgi:hypothetical protein